MTLLFALFGLFLGGIRGMLLGAVAGFLFSRFTQRTTQRDVLRIQEQFVESTFAVVGALCKADGVVTRDEIQFTEGLFERLRLTPAQQAQAKEAFRRGKDADFDLDAEVDRFAATAHGNHALFQMFLRVQLMVILADGAVHPAEHEMLLRIARRLQLSPFEIAQIEALLRAASRGPQSSAWSGQARASAPPARQAIDDAYTTLGVNNDATDAEIKRSYRNLIRDNHPDRLAAKGLPENMRDLAEERTREINAAYALIKRARDLS